MLASVGCGSHSIDCWLGHLSSFDLEQRLSIFSLTVDSAVGKNEIKVSKDSIEIYHNQN